MKKCVLCVSALFAWNLLSASVATFEDLGFASGDSENGANLAGYTDTSNDPWGPGSGSLLNTYSDFTSGTARFDTRYSQKFSGPDGTGLYEYDFWSNWSYSRVTDNTTAGFGNQYSAFPGSGAGGSSTYVVGYVANSTPTVTFNDSPDLAGRGLYVSNTTYAALDMRDGSGFSKKFGGASGDDADWFKLTLNGFWAENPTGSVEFYLADFRFADNSQDYILDTWAFVDLSPLGTVDFIEFELSSSDNNAYGMNTPGYFVIDNVGAIPEPATLGLLLSGLLLIWKLRVRLRAKQG